MSLCARAGTDRPLGSSPVLNPGSEEQVFDRWGPLIRLSSADVGFQDWEPLPIHAVLMPTNPPEVLFVGALRKPQTFGALAKGSHERYCWSLVIDPSFGKPAPSSGSRLQFASSDPLARSTSIVFTREIAQPFERETIVRKVIESDDLFCSGHTLLADGRIVFAGGTRIRYRLQNTSFPAQIFGLDSTAIFDPASRSGSLSRSMTGAGASYFKQDGNGGRIGPLRWYPTLTRLPSGRILTMGGYDVLFGIGSQYQYQPNASIEVFNPATEIWTEMITGTNSRRELLNRTYPHVFVLPEPVERGGTAYDVFILGEAGVPVFLSTSEWKLDVSNNLRPGAPASEIWSSGWGGLDTNPEGVNLQASTVLLPLRLDSSSSVYTNGSVMVVGSDWRHLVESEHIDVYDPTNDFWFDPMALGVNEDNDPIGTPDAHGRANPATVVLPNGQVLIVGGNDPNDDPSLVSSGTNACVQYAYYVDPSELDPVTERFTIRRGSSEMGEQRSYHSVALLLSDGRVLVGGGQDRSGLLFTEKNSLRVLEPAYLFDENGALNERPEFSAVAKSMAYGSTFL